MGSRGGEGDGETTAYMGHAFDGQAAVHEVCEAFDDGQAESGAGVASVEPGFDLDEGMEQQGEFFRGDSDACIGDGDGDGIRGGVDVEGDPASGGGELDGVGKEVGEDLLEAEGISENEKGRGVGGNLELDAFFLGCVTEETDAGIDDVQDGTGLDLDTNNAGFEAGELEDVVDELEQVTAAILNLGDAVEMGFSDGLAGGVAEDFREGQDAGERGAEFVTDVGEELVAALGGLLQCGVGFAEGIGLLPQSGLSLGAVVLASEAGDEAAVGAGEGFEFLEEFEVVGGWSVGEADDADEIGAAEDGDAEEAVEGGMTVGDAASAGIEGGIIGDDDLLGSEDATEQGIEIAEFESGGLCGVVKFFGFGIPRDVGDGVGPHEGVAIFYEGFSNEAVSAVGHLEDGGEELLEDLGRRGAFQELVLDFADGLKDTALPVETI